MSVSSHVMAGSTATPHVAAKPVTTGSGMLRVTVPADAVVYVNGNKTTSTGSQRQYVSHGLESGRGYTYTLRVEYERDGKPVVESKTVKLVAGGDESIAFVSGADASAVAETDAEASDEADGEPAPVTVTKLTLQVPEDATVTLAGAATKQTGAEREFLTTKLPAGTTWEDYTVEVQAVVDGKTITQQRSIVLRGGESQALVFDFSPTVVASLD
ncbi:MAG: TIGR03000 domain-containing protein [Planctomycetota bacterium]